MARNPRRIRTISKPAAHYVVLAALESALSKPDFEPSALLGSFHYTLGSVSALCEVISLMAIPKGDRRRVAEALIYFRKQLPRKRSGVFRARLLQASRKVLYDHTLISALPGVTA